MRGFNEVDYKGIDNAKVEVFTSNYGEGEVVEFHHDEGIKWSASFRPQYGRIYFLSIKIDGREEITAQTQMPADIQIAAHRKNWHYMEGASYFMVSFQLSKQDYSYYGDYNLHLYSGGANLWIFHTKSNVIATDFPYADKFTRTGKTIGDLEFFSPERMSGIPALEREFYGVIPVLKSDCPVYDKLVRIPMPVGYDAGYSDEELLSKDIMEYDSHSFLLFTDNYDWRGMAMDGLYKIFILSNEYDKYYREYYERVVLNAGNILELYNDSNLYSNIKGGYGIFGAKIVRISRGFILGDKDEWYRANGW